MSSAKGCPNGECAAHKKKTLFKPSMNYCPQCGAELAAVCKSRGCYTFLDDPSKKLCARCEGARAQFAAMERGRWLRGEAHRQGRRDKESGRCSLHGRRRCREDRKEIITKRQRGGQL